MGKKSSWIEIPARRDSRGSIRYNQKKPSKAELFIVGMRGLSPVGRWAPLRSGSNRFSSYPWNKKSPAKLNFLLSGWEDSNLRSLAPQTSTLTGLSYIPIMFFWAMPNLIVFMELKNVLGGKWGFTPKCFQLSLDILSNRLHNSLFLRQIYAVVCLTDKPKMNCWRRACIESAAIIWFA